MNDEIEIRKIEARIDEWIMEYPLEWEIVSGIRCASIMHNRRILHLLYNGGFYELAEMMVRRICQMSHDES